MNPAERQTDEEKERGKWIRVNNLVVDIPCKGLKCCAATPDLNAWKSE